MEINPNNTDCLASTQNDWTPKVSIGMPVYNGEKYLRQALDSLLNQSFRSFELIISDNASTDKTEMICREYLEKDNRIRYIKQKKNNGPEQNFQIVLNEAVCDYFMWAAVDDMWDRSFIEKNYLFLEQHPDYVGSISASQVGNVKSKKQVGATIISHPDPRQRIIEFIQYPGYNARYYSLLRTEAVKNFELVKYDYIAGDWGLIIFLLEQGKLNCLNGESGFIKGVNGESRSLEVLFDSRRKSYIELFVPYYFISKLILNKIGFSFEVLSFILIWNLKGSLSYFLSKLKNLSLD